MDTWILAVMLTIISCSSTLENKDGILMRVYEDDIIVQDSWETILHCALSYPNVAHENCTRMWWSHEIDRINHVEENPEDHGDIYRIKTELIKYTSHLEILSFNEKVKGLYKCQAQCGTHVYAVTCEVKYLPQTNRSTLCSEKIFNPAADEPNTQLVSESETNTTVLLGVTVGIGILVAVMVTGFIRWFNKRRAIRKRYRQALHDLRVSRPIARRPLVNPPAQRPSTSNPNPQARPAREEIQVRNVSLPPMPPTLFFNNSGQVPDQVVYQQMPDGSQIVFIPASKLPSYEDSVADDRGALAVSGRLKLLVNPTRPRAASQTEADAGTSGRGGSPHLSERSLPPSYGSIYGGLLDADTGSGHRSSSEDQNSDLGEVEEPHPDLHEPSSSHISQPSLVPLLSDSDRASRLPRWMLGHSPPQHED